MYVCIRMPFRLSWELLRQIWILGRTEAYVFVACSRLGALAQRLMLAPQQEKKGLLCGALHRRCMRLCVDCVVSVNNVNKHVAVVLPC